MYTIDAKRVAEKLYNSSLTVLGADVITDNHVELKLEMADGTQFLATMDVSEVENVYSLINNK